MFTDSKYFGAIRPAVQWTVSSTVLALMLSGCAPSHLEKTRIIEAAGRNDVPALERLASSGAGFDFHALDGLTPLINAARSGSKDAVRFLLAHGADPNYLGDGATSPAYWAAVNCQNETFRLVLSAGGKVRLPDFAQAGFAQRLLLCDSAAFMAFALEAVAREGQP